VKWPKRVPVYKHGIYDIVGFIIRIYHDARPLESQNHIVALLAYRYGVSPHPPHISWSTKQASTDLKYYKFLHRCCEKFQTSWTFRKIILLISSGSNSARPTRGNVFHAAILRGKVKCSEGTLWHPTQDFEVSYSASSAHLRRPRVAVSRANKKRREEDPKQAVRGLVIQKLPIIGNLNFSITTKRYSLDSWIKRDQLDVTCCIISLFNAQHVSDVNTSILRSFRLISWVIIQRWTCFGC